MNVSYLRKTLDTLALALANHSHIWTDEERWLYERSIEMLDADGAQVITDQVP